MEAIYIFRCEKLRPLLDATLPLESQRCGVLHDRTNIECMGCEIASLRSQLAAAQGELKKERAVVDFYAQNESWAYTNGNRDRIYFDKDDSGVAGKLARARVAERKGIINEN